MTNRYSTPNTEHAVNKANEMILEAVQKDMEEFEAALREGRLNDAADIALEQQRPDMADRVLRAGEKAKEKVQNIAQKATSEPEPEPEPQPQPSGASIDQIGDLLDDKLNPIMGVLPRDEHSRLAAVASISYVDRKIKEALKNGSPASAGTPITEMANEFVDNTKTKVTSSVGAPTPSAQTSSTPSMVKRIGAWLTEKKH